MFKIGRLFSHIHTITHFPFDHHLCHLSHSLPLAGTHPPITFHLSKPIKPIFFHYHISISPYLLNLLLSPPNMPIATVQLGNVSMHDAASAQYEKESRGLLHQVFTILARKESNVTHLVLEVEDLILKNENLKSKPKGMILHWLSCFIIRSKPINRVCGRDNTVLRWLFSYMVIRHYNYSLAGSVVDVLIHVHHHSRSGLL